MNRKDYERWNEIEWKRHNVRTLGELRNGKTVIPKGTVCRITAKFGGFTLQTDPCSHCGISVLISRVPCGDVEDMGRR